ncbi:MAG: hypothetical protein HFH62_02450 [Lachnospiraceae bacterium]|nr:hypothetical protein [Lachnospiraceae bacterium]
MRKSICFLGGILVAIVLFFGASFLMERVNASEDEIEDCPHGKIFAQMNRLVDKKNKPVYERYGIQMQMTDYIAGEGNFYCILAAWCKDGEKKQLCQKGQNMIQKSEEDGVVTFWDNVGTGRHSVYYEDGITYILYYLNDQNEPKNREKFLTFSMTYSKNGGNVQDSLLAEIPIAAWQYFEEKGSLLRKEKGYAVYRQRDGSYLVLRGMMSMHLTQTGMLVRYPDERCEEVENEFFYQKKMDKRKIEISLNSCKNRIHGAWESMHKQGDRQNIILQRNVWSSDTLIPLGEVESLFVDGEEMRIQ